MKLIFKDEEFELDMVNYAINAAVEDKLWEEVLNSDVETVVWRAARQLIEELIDIQMDVVPRIKQHIQDEINGINQFG